jgi:peptidoglycan-associated lipoprotein
MEKDMGMISLKNLAFASVAILALAACETAPSDSATAGGAGGAGAGDGSVLPGSQADLERVGDRVFFATDSSVISGQAQGTLEAQSAWLKQYPDVNVVVEGHADERGTREYNIALGERRANAAKNYLVSLGVNPARISTISYGKERPAVLGSSESAWSQNRRAVTVVSE